MAIQKIEEYRMKNGDDILKVFCKPTKNFPEGNNYFYAPAEAIDLVNSLTWGLHKVGHTNINRVEARRLDKHILFHKELCYVYRGYYVSCIDHINMIDIDNTDKNLNIVTTSQNLYNTFSKGYYIKTLYKEDFNFIPKIWVNDYDSHPFGYINRNEDETCILQNELEQVWLKEQLGREYYMFDFKKYRRGSEDILDLERTGVISEEEATYRHILRYADNAWYYLRYGLQDYFQQYNIPIPKYSLDEQGFMIHPITGEKLCPFYK